MQVIFAWLEESAGIFKGWTWGKRWILLEGFYGMTSHEEDEEKTQGEENGHAKVYLARNQRRGSSWFSHSKVHNYCTRPGKHRKNALERSTMLSIGTSTNCQWSFSSSQTLFVITRVFFFTLLSSFSGINECECSVSHNQRVYLLITNHHGIFFSLLVA